MAKKSAPIIRNLERETEAAKNLAFQIHQIIGDETADDSGENAQLQHDMIEGETDLFKAIDNAVEFIAMDLAHIEGLKALAEKIKARMDRKELRIDTTKVAILTALEISGLPRHEGALATISQAQLPIKLIVTEESQIDSKFFKIPDPLPPALDKRELLAYLKERDEALEALADIPEETRPQVAEQIAEKYPPVVGAELSNGGTRLNLRFK